MTSTSGSGRSLSKADEQQREHRSSNPRCELLFFPSFCFVLGGYGDLVCGCDEHSCCVVLMACVPWEFGGCGSKFSYCNMNFILILIPIQKSSTVSCITSLLTLMLHRLTLRTVKFVKLVLLFLSCFTHILIVIISPYVAWNYLDGCFMP